MDGYYQTVSVAGIRIRTESPIPFRLSELCSPFAVDGKDADAVIELYPGHHPAEKVITEENRITETAEGAVFRDDMYEVKVWYTDLNRKGICWYLVRYIQDDTRYILCNLDSQYVYDGFNPLVYVDLSVFLIKFRAMVLHASLIDWQGMGIVFTAPSGTGKSTQASLWETFENAKILNGDRAVLRARDGGFVACGSPYAGSSHIYVNASVPLRAIVVLEQAKQNVIRRLKGRAAYLPVLSQLSISSWNRRAVEKQTTLALELTERIPVFLLQCLPNREAVETLLRELGDLN